MIGRYADKVGKKPALILTSLITGTATLCMALLPIQWLGSYTPITILFIQMALSFSYAGEYPSLITYLINDTPDNERSRLSSLSGGSSLLGVVVSLGLVFTLENILTHEMMQTIGWRIPLFLGTINIAISFWFRAKLPNQPVVPMHERSIDWSRALHVFLVSTPAMVTFYVQNVSSSLIVEHLQLGDYKNIYGMISASLLLVTMIVCSYLTDKYSYSVRVFNVGIFSVIIFSIPLYFIMQSGVIELIIISQLIITVLFSMVWCNVADQMVRASGGQATTLGIGLNLNGVLVGGITPLIISYLVEFNLTYVGVFIALCCLTAMLSNVLQNKVMILKNQS